MTPQKIDLNGLHIEAISVGGVETCIAIPSWKMCFDIGRCPSMATKLRTVLFTHPHVDHLGGIVTHVATRELHKQPPPRYCIPNLYVNDVEALLATWRRLNRSEFECEIVGTEPGVAVTLGGGRSALPFRAIHRVPTLGYGIQTIRKKLRPAFLGLPGKKIGQLKSEGVDLFEEVSAIEVAFCGDTTVGVLDDPVVQAAERLILECTFVGDRVAPDKATRTGHIHLSQLAEHADKLHHKAILLTHFSARYGREEIREEVAKTLPKALQNRVQLLLHPRD